VRFKGRTFRVLLGLPCTLGVIYFVPQSALVLMILSVFWWLLFHPWELEEILLFFTAAAFFLFQNYFSLSARIFEFKVKDVLLMPLYEPFLWGFYFMTLKRIVSGNETSHVHRNSLDIKGAIGLLITSATFSLFSRTSWFFAATVLSSVGLFVLFHTKRDFSYAGASLLLGLIVELFGVSTGFWFYPAPDFLGIPYWFAPMWISVGLLGWRFLIPLSGQLAAKLRTQGA
jgi:hypothetical protein